MVNERKETEEALDRVNTRLRELLKIKAELSAQLLMPDKARIGLKASVNIGSLLPNGLVEDKAEWWMSSLPRELK
jgi:hypothetical protein